MNEWDQGIAKLVWGQAVDCAAREEQRLGGGGAMVGGKSRNTGWNTRANAVGLCI